MKIMTIVGTRPEIIRLSMIIPKLDKYSDHILVHTGQNYDPNLKDIFFKELQIRQPNYNMTCKGDTPFEAIGNILTITESLITKEDPDKLLILGDTNSGLSSIVAKRYGVKVYHMEAGNRCFDDTVPEEINRRIIDHSSDILLPYTQNSKQNLIAEGIPQNKIFVTGNPIQEVMCNYILPNDLDFVTTKYGFSKQNYFVITLHRAENVDNIERLQSLLHAFKQIASIYKIPVIMSMHPRTKFAIFGNGETIPDGIITMPPFPFKEFIALEKNAFCVISDSGTVQEECNIMNVPNVTIRNTTERPETLECGSNIISGFEASDVIRSINIATNLSNWEKIPEYDAMNVSNVVTKILLGVYP